MPTRNGHLQGRPDGQLGVLGRGAADLGQPYEQPQRDHGRGLARLVCSPHSRCRRPGLLQGRARDLPSAKVAPLGTSSGGSLSLYDPKTEKFTLIDTCFTTQHLYFGHDANNTLVDQRRQRRLRRVVGWLNTKKFLETGDAKTSQGWSPLIVDVPTVRANAASMSEADRPVDPAKQKRVIAGVLWRPGEPCGRHGLGPIDGCRFLASGRTGLSSSTSFRDPTPPNTAHGRIVPAARGRVRAHAASMSTSKGVAWTALSSGHMASFDRSKCKRAVEGPGSAVTGRQCAEGWTLYPFPWSTV